MGAGPPLCPPEAVSGQELCQEAPRGTGPSSWEAPHLERRVYAARVEVNLVYVWKRRFLGRQVTQQDSGDRTDCWRVRWLSLAAQELPGGRVGDATQRTLLEHSPSRCPVLSSLLRPQSSWSTLRRLTGHPRHGRGAQIWKLLSILERVRSFRPMCLSPERAVPYAPWPFPGQTSGLGPQLRAPTVS